MKPTTRRDPFARANALGRPRASLFPFGRFAGGNRAAVGGGAATVNPSVRAVSTGTGAAGASSITLPTRASGDILVAVVIKDDGITNAANTGWTKRVSTDDGVAIGLAIYTKTSDGTDSQPGTGTMSSAYAYTVIAVKDPAVGFDVAAAGTPGNGTTIVAPTVTTTGAADVLVSAYLANGGAAAITPPAGQTATTQVNTMFGTLRCGYESLAAAGATGTRTATLALMAGGCGSGSVAVK